ncbi:LOW QUALITY PROTEIN: hypothetical protein HID58_077525, partial [Brassica napus]
YIRDEERLESQKCLVEEGRKNKTLSEQVEKIKELISVGVPHYNKNQSGRTRKTPESPQVTTMRKRSRQTEDMVEMDTETLLVSQPQCCKTTDCGSSNSASCPFQALGEHLTGVKLSTNNKDKRICIVASHPSSDTYFLLAHSLCAKVLKSSATRKAPIFNITPWLLTMTGLSFTLTWVNNYADEEAAVQG